MKRYILSRSPINFIKIVSSNKDSNKKDLKINII